MKFFFLLLLSVIILIVFDGCNKNDAELPFLLSDNCKIESVEIFMNQGLEQIKINEYDNDFNPVKLVEGYDINNEQNSRYFIQKFIYDGDKQLKSKLFSVGKNEASATETYEEIYFYNDTIQLLYIELQDFGKDEKYKSLVYEYHGNGKLKKKIYYKSDGIIEAEEVYNDYGDIIKNYQYNGVSYYEYDSKRNLIKQESYEAITDEKLREQTIYEYNNIGLTTKSKVIYWKEDGSIHSIENNYTYNAKNNLSSENLIIFDSETNQETKETKVYEYDQHDLLVKVLHDTESVLTSYSVIVNDNSGREISNTNYLVSGENEIRDSEIITTYWYNGKIHTKTYNMFPKKKLVYQYDQNGNQVLSFRINDDGVEDYKEVTKYICK